MIQYAEFLAEKRRTADPAGIDPGEIHGLLYPFQAAIVRWAVRMGRAALFEYCGLGKTYQQLEWVRQIIEAKGGCGLIVAPLCVAEQTIKHAESMGLELVKVSEPTDDEYQITNYEKLHRFDQDEYTAIVLDESSILKSVDGKTRTRLLEEFTDIPYRLCCTATPAPNDVAEMANHAQFLGVMKRAEMLATFFVHEDNQHWRLKGHASGKFYEWLASWCVFIRGPQDIGFHQGGYALPPLDISQHVVEAEIPPSEGMLFAVPEAGIRGRLKARKSSIEDRVAAVAEMIAAEPDKQWLVWHGLNDEGRQLKKLLGDDAVLVEGSDTEGSKVAREAAWRGGIVQTLISKPKIFGWGMNWQHCCRVAFLGLGDSYEQYYQAIRRTWRYGQQQPVAVHVVVSDLEQNVVSNVERKKEQAETMADEVVKQMGDLSTKNIRGEHAAEAVYVTDGAEDHMGRWKMMLGDCCDRIADVPDQSVGLSVFSPPFATLYTYSNSERDMGNSRDYGEFFEHYRYLCGEMLRVTQPGRRCCTHVQQVAMTKVAHGVIGMRDFRADVVRVMVESGWIYDGEVVIDKCPQAQAIRTKSKQLMFVQLKKDSSWVRPGMADYILLFRAPGENAEPVKTDVTNEEWILWARPIWYGIRESDTLHTAEARDEKDERHICPLQLGTIERCVRLWSNEGDTIFSPFGGIGSEGYQALRLGRKYIGIELKQSYYDCAIRNLEAASQPTLFDA